MKYNAFISYRHTPLDMKVAKKLHKSLETFRIPASVHKKTGKKRIQRVFRDQEELPIGSDLNENILNALTESEYLIVVCSPNTPKSEWVSKEIETFIRLHDRNHVLAILIDGEPEDSFPGLLVTDEEGNNVEPLAADIRGASSHERDKKFKTELLRLIAPLIGCTYDDLKQRHKERIIKRNLTIGFSAAGLVAILSVFFGIYNASVARKMQHLMEQIQEESRLKQISQSKYSATVSAELLKNGNRKEAALMAMSGLPGTDDNRPFVSDSAYALSNALHTYTVNSFEMDKRIPLDFTIDCSFVTDDYSKLITTDISGAVYVWDSDSMELLCKIIPENNDNSILDISADDSFVYICFGYGGIQKYDYEGNCLSHLELIDKNIRGCDFHISEQQVALNSPSKVYIVDLNSFSVINTMETDYYLWSGLSYSPSDNCICLEGSRNDDDFMDGLVIINTATKEYTFTDLSKSFEIIDSQFTPSGDIIILYESAEAPESTDEPSSNTVEKTVTLYSKKGESVWSYTIESNYANPTESHSDNLSQNICKIKDKEYYLVGISVQNKLMIFDGTNGEVMFDAQVTGSITGFELNYKIALYSLDGGNLYALSYDTGESEIVLNTGLSNNQMLLCPGHEGNNYSLVFQPKQDSCYYTVSYREPSAEDLLFLWDEFVTVSPTGHYFVFELKMHRPNSLYYIYGENGNIVDNFMNVSDLSFFFFGDTLISCQNEELFFYNPIQKTTDTVSLKDVFGYSENNKYNYYYEDDNPYLIGVNSHSVVVMNLLNREKIFEYSDDSDTILSAAVSPTGESVLVEKSVVNPNNNQNYYYLYMVNTNSKKEKLLHSFDPANTFQIKQFTAPDSDSGIKISNDDRFASLLCSDNRVRLINLKKDELITEFPVISDYKTYMNFSPDNQIFFYQSENSIELYDTENRSVVNSIKTDSKAELGYYDEENQLFILICKSSLDSLSDSRDLFLINQEDFGLLAEAPGGFAYLPESRELFTHNKLFGYSILHYKTVGELIEDAKNQFPDIDFPEE